MVSAEEHKVGKESTRPRERAWPPPHGNGKLLDGLSLQHILACSFLDLLEAQAAPGTLQPF